MSFNYALAKDFTETKHPLQYRKRHLCFNYALAKDFTETIGFSTLIDLKRGFNYALAKDFTETMYLQCHPELNPAVSIMH